MWVWIKVNFFFSPIWLSICSHHLLKNAVFPPLTCLCFFYASEISYHNETSLHTYQDDYYPKNWKITSIWRGRREIGTLPHCWCGCTLVNLPRGKQLTRGTATWPSGSIPRCVARGTEGRLGQAVVALFTVARRWKQPRCLVNRWIDKQNVVCTHNGLLLFSRRKEGDFDICYHMDGPWKRYHVKWNEPNIGEIL